MNFAANLSMMFAEHDFLDRFEAARKAGFRSVEYLFPYDWPAAEVKKRLDAAALHQVLFNLPPGDWNAGERGLASLPGREGEFDESLAIAMAYARELNSFRVHCMAGMRDEAVSFTQQRATFIANVRKAASAFSGIGVDVLIEPINPVDMPGYFLNDFALALELLDEINQEAIAPVKLQFDIYHCQRIHGGVPAWLERCRNHTAHLQIAGTPDRHEPDRGDLALDAILGTVQALHPDLWIGCEYRPAGRTEDGLGWINRWR